ncbi:MAG: MATE family efflux transporter, partial [Solobacterium sp.]|nr:MATE family efflux transporter [Solobacterium sp.]
CAPFYFTYSFIEILSGAIRGSGEGFVPMAISLTAICLFRFVWITLIAPRIGGTVEMIAACYPASWIAAGMIFIAYYLRYRKKFAQ